MPAQKPRRVLRALRLHEISAVDRPAQPGARAAITKRAEPVEKRVWLTSIEDGHQHVIDETGWDGAMREAGDTSWAKSEGEKEGHSHPWVRNPDGTISIGLSEGHGHTLLDPQVFKAKPAAGGKDGDPEMTTKTPEQLAAEVTKANADRDAATAKVARLEKVAGLPLATRPYFDGLPVDKQDAFLAKDAAGQSAEVAAHEANKADKDPVVYKSAVTGKEYRKSAGDEVIDLARRLDASEKSTRESREKSMRDVAKADAEKNYPTLPGEPVEKGEALFALRAVDPKAAETIEKMLAAGEAAMATTTKAAGHEGGADKGGTVEKGTGRVIGKAETALNAKAVEIMKTDPTKNFFAAFTKAMEDNPDLYNAYDAEQRGKAA